MKKILAALAAALLLCCPVTAFAAETQLDTAPASQGIEVYGQCISNKNYYEIVLGTERADSAHLPDGVVISGRSSASEDRGLRVIIIPVTAAEEPEAYAWLSGAAQDLGKEPVAYYAASRRCHSHRHISPRHRPVLYGRQRPFCEAVLCGRVRFHPFPNGKDRVLSYREK